MGLALVSFGANLGSPEEKYLDAISRLHAFPGISVICAGRLNRTTPVGGPTDQPSFQNGAILLEVDLPPHEVLAQLHNIESALGRIRTDYWGPREIDLDLLLYEDFETGHGKPVFITSETLTLPHPRFHYRRFALAPAAELAGDLLHPIFQFTVAELFAHLDRQPRIIAIAGENPTQNRDFALEIARRSGAPFLEQVTSGETPTAKEYVTTYGSSQQSVFPPQLVIYLTDEPAQSEIPSVLNDQLKATGFSTWTTVVTGDIEAALVEGAAAVAAMRPFEPQ